MTNKKTRLLQLMVLMLSVSIGAAFFTACSKEDESDSAETEVIKNELNIEGDYFEDEDYMNEDDGAELITTPHDESDYVGKWVAPSERAEYLYGNVNLKLNDDHSWSGNITEENFKGRWAYDGKQVVIKSSDRIIHWNLFYVADGNLMCDDLDDPGKPLVLKKAVGGQN